MSRLSLTIVVVCACAASGPVPEVAIDDGKGDGGGAVPVAVALGDRVEDRVLEVRDPDGASTAELAAAARVFTLELANGEAALLSMRAIDEGLDCELVVLNEDVVRIATGTEQALLPGSRVTDSVVSIATEGRYYVVAQSAGFASGGRFRLDVVPLSAAPEFDVAVTNARIRAVHGELRQQQALLDGHLDSGLWLDTSEGVLVEDPDALETLSLAEIAEARRALSAINRSRLSLFSALEQATAASRTHIAGVAVVAWAATR